VAFTEVTLAEARRNAINALNYSVTYGLEDVRIEAARLLLSIEPEPDIIVDAGDAPYVPCDCPVCDPDVDDRYDIPDDLPGAAPDPRDCPMCTEYLDPDERAIWPLTLHYEVFFQ
jgi:hypothetical protein